MISATTILTQANENDAETTSQEPVEEDLSSKTPKFHGMVELGINIDCRDEIFCCEMSPSGKLIAVGTNKGITRVFDVEKGTNLYALVDVDIRLKYLPAVCCSWLDETKLLVGYASGQIKIWNIQNQECLTTINEDRVVLQTVQTPTGDAFITAGNNAQIYIYSIHTLQKIMTCEPSAAKNIVDGHNSSVYALKHHPNDIWNFVSAGWDDTVHFWDRRESRSTRKIFGPHICGQAIDIDPVENTVLTASWRRQNGLQLWDYRETKLLKTYEESPTDYSLYYGAQFLGSSHFMAAGSNHNVFKIKDKRLSTDLGRVKNLNRGVFCLDHRNLHKVGEDICSRIAFGYSTNLVLADVRNLTDK